MKNMKGVIAMAFFDDLKSSVEKYAKIIGEKAENLADVSANKFNIYTQKDKITKLYKKLGQYVYENRNALGESEIGSILQEIENEHAILRKLESDSKENEKPKYVRCACGYEVRSMFSYCPKCGRKL